MVPVRAAREHRQDFRPIGKKCELAYRPARQPHISSNKVRVPPPIPSRPMDATLCVTKAARLLGVHPNTVRAWSDQGRLRYYRINPRGDRRYRLGDLQGFLAAAEVGAPPEPAAVGRTTTAGRAAAGRNLHDTAVAAPRP